MLLVIIFLLLFVLYNVRYTCDPGVTAAAMTAGGKALNHAQIQFYKQQQLLRQQQQRLIRDHQLKVLQAQSASNQKVTVAVTTGTAMGIATVAGVTAVQVSQAQQQRAQVTKFLG